MNYPLPFIFEGIFRSDFIRSEIEELYMVICKRIYQIFIVRVKAYRDRRDFYRPNSSVTILCKMSSTYFANNVFRR